MLIPDIAWKCWWKNRENEFEFEFKSWLTRDFLLHPKKILRSRLIFHIIYKDTYVCKHTFVVCFIFEISHHFCWRNLFRKWSYFSSIKTLKLYRTKIELFKHFWVTMNFSWNLHYCSYTLDELCKNLLTWTLWMFQNLLPKTRKQ